MAPQITNQDAAFYGRNKPAWHGLGVVPDNGIITKRDVITAFDYVVSKVPLFTADGDATTTFATIRTLPDGRRVVLGDKLSAEYKVLQNGELIKTIDPLMEAGCMLETAISLNQGRRFVIIMRLPGDMSAGKNDTIARFVMVSNDHTGAETARIGFTPVRVECANMLAMALADKASHLIRIRHQGDVLISLERARDMMDLANGQFLAFGDTVDALAGTAIVQADLDAYVKRVFFPKLQPVGEDTGLAAREKARTDADALLKMQNRINEIFQTEPSVAGCVDTNGTAYGAWQAVNFYLNHVQNIGQERRLHNIGWGSGRQTDTRALEAAKELAASKI